MANGQQADDDPFAKYAPAQTQPPAATEDDPFAKYAQPVGTGEDVLRTIPSSVIKFGAGVAMAPTDVPAAIAQGAGALATSVLGVKPGQEQAVKEAQSKLGTTMVDPDTGEELPMPFTSPQVLKSTLGGVKIGDQPLLYNPQTEAGRLTEKGIGYGLGALVPYGPSAMARALIGAGSFGASEGARAAAKAAGLSPAAVEATDLLTGFGTSLMGGRWGANRLAPLTQTARNDAATLGKIGVTGTLETAPEREYSRQAMANVGPKGVVEGQLSDFNRGVAREMGITPGVDDRISPEALNKAIENMTTSVVPQAIKNAEISGQQFQDLSNAVPGIIRTAQRRVNPASAEYQALVDMGNKITQGAHGTGTALSITGDYYQALRDGLNTAISNASAGTKDAYVKLADALRTAMENSKGGPELHDVLGKYRSLMKLKGTDLGPAEKITPDILANSLSAEDLNRGRGLGPYARAGQRMIQPLPGETPPAGKWVKALTGLGTAAAVGGPAHYFGGQNPWAAAGEAATPAIWASEYAAPIVGGAIRGVGRAAYDPLIKALIGPQTSATPGQAAALAAALAAPRVGGKALPPPNQAQQ